MSRRVLVVDDDESIRNFVSLALAYDGYEVMCASHGAAALELVAESPPSLILLDMRMPVLDGWGFARAYRERPGPRAPIIVLTAARDADRRASEIGAAGYLAKPFDLDDLFALVERHMLRADGNSPNGVV